jgi:hypothetical protein
VAGWASGRAAAAAGTATSSMFPYALIDILTHFGMTDAEFRQEIGRHNSRPPLSRASTEYFNAHRAAVRTRVQPMLTGPNIRFQDAVREAATYFRQGSTILAAAPPPDGGVRTAGR